MSRFRYFAIYKPFQTLSQFSPEVGKRTLKDYFSVPKDVYPVGRLDYDSEGLLLLTNDPKLNQALLHPRNAHNRTYYVQVEGIVSQAAVSQLKKGVEIGINGKVHTCRAVEAQIMGGEPQLPDRNPPIRFRKTVPAPWLSLTLREGKNRQVRKMCAAVGAPVLRLVRISIEELDITGWASGDIKELSRIDISRYMHV
ncbi:pseudouridine synthase [Arachidicoccus terrestris]|uniref:pseudouridine synthase n=1 Tax=Arachidicoccus terrestris TaxID=2875539 RepID=UPI001CC6E412|nr:pseudouridine synthase [Arachidicoccus terrestris]UAY56538.1 pseudouridine synthase [Arachidicoccus terrestris]